MVVHVCVDVYMCVHVTRVRMWNAFTCMNIYYNYILLGIATLGTKWNTHAVHIQSISLPYVILY
jgi:hypothetical protein